MKPLVIAIITVIGVVIPLAIAAFFMFRNKGAKHPFLLYHRDGHGATIIHGKVKSDPQNSSKKQFVFETLNTFLPIAKPTLFLNRVAYREIIQDDKGDYCYLNRELDKDSLRLGLEPEEKELSLFRYRENQKRYENPMNKLQAGMVIAGFILILIIMIGVIYSTVAYVNASSNVVKMTKDSVEVQKIMQNNLNVMKEISIQQTQIVATLKDEDAEINRQIS